MMLVRPHEHKAQYYETDGMGIIHHANYLRWFEEARVDLLEQLGIGYDLFEANGVASPVTSISCDYKSPVRFAETVLVTASIRQYTGTRLTVSYEVRDKMSGALRCTGESHHCFLSRATGRPVSLKRVWADAHTVLLTQLEAASR